MPPCSTVPSRAVRGSIAAWADVHATHFSPINRLPLALFQGIIRVEPCRRALKVFASEPAADAWFVAPRAWRSSTCRGEQGSRITLARPRWSRWRQPRPYFLGRPRFANEIPPASAALRSKPAFKASIFSCPLGIVRAASKASPASASRPRLKVTRHAHFKPSDRSSPARLRQQDD